MGVSDSVDDLEAFVGAGCDDGRIRRGQYGDGRPSGLERVSNADPPRGPVGLGTYGIDVAAQVQQGGGDAVLPEKVGQPEGGIALGDASQVQHAALLPQINAIRAVHLQVFGPGEGKQRVDAGCVGEPEPHAGVKVRALRLGGRLPVDPPQFRQGAHQRVEGPVRQGAGLPGVLDDGEDVGGDANGLHPGRFVDSGEGGALLKEGELAVQIIQEGEGFAQDILELPLVSSRRGDVDGGVHGDSASCNRMVPLERLAPPEKKEGSNDQDQERPCP